MSYSLDKIKEKINKLSGVKTAENSDKPKLVWWKPGLGDHQIRFLPYRDKNGQPFQEVAYYDSKLLSERRIVAGFQFGLEDPIFEMLTKLRKDRSKEAWQLWRNLQPRERYYAPIVVRGEEEKGVQVWELSGKVVKDIYSILAHPDYKDEDMMSAEEGYDFTISVTPTDKTFNGYPVKDIKPQPRRKSSPLSTKKEEAEKWLANIPNFEAYFQAQVQETEALDNMLTNFLASSKEESNDLVEETKESTDDIEKGHAKVEAAIKAAAEKSKSTKTKRSVEEAFEDL